MEDKIMIVKKDDDCLRIKVRKKMKNAFAPNEYVKVVNLQDANDLALLIDDIAVMFGAPVDKAFRIYLEKKNRGFPF